MSKELKKDLMLIEKNLDFVKKNYEVKNIGVFGSVASGKEKKSSDIDILVELKKPIGFFKFLELEEFLSRKLKRKVDLVTEKALRPAIKKEILKEVIYV